MDPTEYATMAQTEAGHWWYVGRRRIIESVIGRLALPGDAEILEIGCGTGGNLAMLGRYGAITGVEPEDDAIDVCRARHPGARIVRGGLPGDLPLEGRTYDLIAMFDVLEHVADDAGGVLAACRHLKQGGWAVCTVPAIPALWSRRDAALHHRRRYTKSALKALFPAPFYAIERCTHFNTLLLPLAVCSRLAANVFHRELPEARMPPPFVNAVLTRLFSLERGLVGTVPLPLGLSLLLVARKDG